MHEVFQLRGITDTGVDRLQLEKQIDLRTQELREILIQKGGSIMTTQPREGKDYFIVSTHPSQKISLRITVDGWELIYPNGRIPVGSTEELDPLSAFCLINLGDPYALIQYENLRNFREEVHVNNSYLLVPFIETLNQILAKS